MPTRMGTTMARMDGITISFWAPVVEMAGTRVWVAWEVAMVGAEKAEVVMVEERVAVAINAVAIYKGLLDLL